MKIKKYGFKIFPYFSSILMGILFYLTGIYLNENLKGLFTNLSAAFFAIPLIFLFYQIADSFSQKKLNKKLFDYAKKQIDAEILSLIIQLYGILYALRKKGISFQDISKLLSLKEVDIKEIISKEEYLGFQIFKTWEVNVDNLDKILRNSYINNIFENNQIISIVSIIETIKGIDYLQWGDNLYIDIGKEVNSYKVVKGTEIHKENIKFPNRYLLLKDLGNDKFLVENAGDFPPYKVNSLLKIFKINEKYLEIYSAALSDLISEINKWLDLTGREFILEHKMFKVEPRIINKRAFFDKIVF